MVSSTTLVSHFNSDIVWQRWWDTTGYFPGIPGKDNPTIQNQTNRDLSLVFLHVDRGNDTDLRAQDIDSELTGDLATYGSRNTSVDEPTLSIQALLTTLSLSSVSTTTSYTTTPDQSLLSTSLLVEDRDMCSVWYKVLFDYFEIYSKNFDITKFGTDGSGLKAQIKGITRMQLSLHKDANAAHS